MERLIFTDGDTGEQAELYLLEETSIGGVTYYLATEEESEDSLAYIFKEICSDDDELTLEIVEDDTELNAIAKVFAELIDDTDITLS
ncbi:MAG: DUF1292 domain-containing protein [Eubacterium sp.]|nr:DUF1292 domain-containing protein [Lachnospiraceae bacterium]MBQ7447584.1 DUF1292 domain-containing protein [Eubacterium sp.]MBQ9023032.1 DUF1292 domain-containing protein [Eubacterium sp.]